MALCAKCLNTLNAAQTARSLSTSCKAFGFKASKLVMFKGMNQQMKQNMLDRKKRKLRKLSKVAAKYIPIADFDVNEKWNTPERQREAEALSAEEKYSRNLLEKEWSAHSAKLRIFEDRKLEALLVQQHKALQELYAESPSLYAAALEPEPSFPVFSFDGPVQTLPVKGYLAPLGGYFNNKPDFSDDFRVAKD